MSRRASNRGRNSTHSFIEPIEPRTLLTGSPDYANRGWVSIIIDHTIATSIAPKLEQFKRDLIGDGFVIAPDAPGAADVLAHTNAPRMDDENFVWHNTTTPIGPVTLEVDEELHHLDQYKLDLQDVKDIINYDAAAATSAGSQLTQVILIGHVTVPYSGGTNGTAHEAGAAPTDLYYADLDGTPATWGDSLTLVTNGNDPPHEATTNEPGDGRFDVSAVPSDGDSERVELGIGRIDMANLDAAFPTAETATEFEVRLIKQYLDRDHDRRTGNGPNSQGALIDPISTNYGGSFYQSALQPTVGTGNVTFNSSDTWLSEFADSDPTHYLFAVAMDTGDFDTIWHAQNATIKDPQFASYHFDSTPVNGVFTMVYGSYMTDWNSRSLRAQLPFHNYTQPNGGGPYPFEGDPDHPVKASLIRSLLAAEGDALVSSFASPTPLVGNAPLAAGFVAGDAYRESNGLVWNQLLGDPTIRMSYVKPVATSAMPVTETIDLETGHATITWKASPDVGTSTSGYKVYRADTISGAFNPVSATVTYNSGTATFNLVDPNATDGDVYMVRAIKDETTGLGTYTNASTGVLATKVIISGSDEPGSEEINLTRKTAAADAPLGVYTTGYDGTPDYELDLSVVNRIEVLGNDYNEFIHVGFDNGSPVPAGGLMIDAGPGASTLRFMTSSAAQTVSFTAGQTTASGQATIDGATVDYASMLSVWYVGGGESLGEGQGDTVNVGSGVTNLILWNEQFHKLDVAGGAKAQVAASSQSTLRLDELDLHGTSTAPLGTLDLNDNDLIVRNVSYNTIASKVAHARNQSTLWTGTGITSSAAGVRTETGLGTLAGAEYAGFGHSNHLFNGLAFQDDDVIVKYTYNGDATLAGNVNFDSYVRIDTGYNQQFTGWANGDFNYDGYVGFDDYVLIDIAFNQQGGGL